MTRYLTVEGIPAYREARRLYPAARLVAFPSPNIDQPLRFIFAVKDEDVKKVEEAQDSKS
jgi:hypothetical protein